MTESSRATPGTPLPALPHRVGRRGLLAGAGAAGTALSAAAACSGGQSIGGADEAPQAASETFVAEYDGPEVTITFWNGFTGGDGPYMKQLVKEFTEANPKITVKQSSLEWPDFYSKVVTATDAEEAMRTSPRCTWTSWRASPPAGRSCRWTISQRPSS